MTSAGFGAQEALQDALYFYKSAALVTQGMAAMLGVNCAACISAHLSFLPAFVHFIVYQQLCRLRYKAENTTNF